LSSWFARRLRLLLWVAAGLVAAALFAYIAYAEIRPSSTDRVNAYIAEVHEVQRELSIEISRINQAYRQFAEQRPVDELLPKLAQAEGTIAALRVRLRQLEPPAEARELHAAILRLLAEDAKIASEVTATAAYLGELGELGKPLQTSAGSLRRGLARARTADAQSVIFAAYAKRIRLVRAQANTIDPPQAFEPSHRAFIRRLGETAALTARLAAAASAGDVATASTTAAQLQRLSDPRPAARQAERAAIAAYNERVKGVEALLLEVERERQELAKELA